MRRTGHGTIENREESMGGESGLEKVPGGQSIIYLLLCDKPRQTFAPCSVDNRQTWRE